ncbi:MAG TPA: sialidase family protein, partial [Candidatus Polarisedimenticolia bacterium]|nr:sialidase family protein [Candidatus Polarisedimenticolia bacterium]
MPNRPGCGRAALFSAAICLLTIPPAVALPGRVGPLEQVSGASPFDGCTADQPGSQGGGFAPDSEVEPWIGVNPDDPLNMVATWQQDRWTNGGSRGLVVGVTHNGGSTWTIVPVPGLSRCSGGTYLRASDPWLSFAPNGDLHHISLSFSPGGTNAMLVNKSTDGGRTWSDPVTLIVDSGPFFNDKETITADPTNRNFVYAVWDRLESFNNQGPAVYTRSTNGGRTWDPVRTLYNPGTGAQTIGNQIVVQPNGTVLDFFNEI